MANFTKRLPRVGSRRGKRGLLGAILALLVSLAGVEAQTTTVPPPPDFFVNLQSFPLYLKAGFESADTASPATGDGAWLVKERWSNVIISRQGLAGLPGRVFLSPWGRPEEEWTFALPFVLERPAPPLPGLYLAAIGDNWEIYLNGTLVRREMHLEGSKIREHHSQRDVFFPIDRPPKCAAIRRGKERSDWT